jgi:hypothetical protein
MTSVAPHPLQAANDMLKKKTRTQIYRIKKARRSRRVAAVHLTAHKAVLAVFSVPAAALYSRS